MTDQTQAIAVQSLAKAFGRTAVLQNLDLAMPAGQILVMLGANGAGKTTFLRILATLTRADSGKALVNGFDIASQPEEVRRTTGVVTHSAMLYGDLTVRENLHFAARMFRMPGREARAGAVARQLDIDRRLGDRVRTLSHGLQKRVALARALLHRPSLLVLDEPESGLDQVAVGLFERVLSDHKANGGSAVVTTHSVDRGLALGDRLVILARGHIVFDQPRTGLDSATLRDIYARYAEPN
ncbi:MAG: heme ABC exporter ATP-binding protein CcmA [Chloroflexi bacterium]|nr:heme ABC exporter ATP-binding protein CcmA [Chloroflexota bacterium]